MSQIVQGAQPAAGGPPWIQPALQERIAWRDGDVVISVPPKSGTTWTMNIVYQLLAGGTRDFSDVYAEVPWIEFVAHPGQSHQEILDRLDAMPTNRRRAFKTHSAPPQVPFVKAGSGRDVKYVVVFRDPEEAMVSFWPFLAKHSEEWADLWGMPHDALKRPDFASFYADVIASRGFHTHAFFGFLNAWWPLRGEPNVLFMHYANMKQDHEGSIRRIGEFVGVSHGEEEWSRILEYTSFPWMKQHEDRFEAATVAPVPILKRGAMIRQGEAGKASRDGMTPEISQELRTLGEGMCPDTAALHWFYTGEMRA